MIGAFLDLPIEPAWSASNAYLLLAQFMDWKRRGHHASLGPRAGVAIARHAHNFGILEDREIKIHGFFSLAVVPEEME